MQNLDQNLEKLEANLELRFPTPQVILDLMSQEESLQNKYWHLSDIDCMTADQIDELDRVKHEMKRIPELIRAAIIAENHLLSLVRCHIFIADLSVDELNTLICVKDFTDQLDKHPSKLYDEAFIDTLISNGIDTAKKFDDLIDSYFAVVDLQDIRNYVPLNPELMKFIGLDITDDLRLSVNEIFTDENTGEKHIIPIDKLILSKGIVTESSLRSSDPDQIMTALQNQLASVIAEEDYTQARVLQTQLDKLK